MMKRIAAMLLILSMASVALANPGGPISADVTSNSVMILCERGQSRSSVPLWAATNLYNNGDVRRVGSRFYMMYGTNGSTSGSTAPTHAQGIGTDDTLNWYRVPTGKRIGASFYNYGSTDVWLSMGYTAVTNQGHYLKANGGNVQITEFQGPVYAIHVGATTNTISLQEH